MSDGGYFAIKGFAYQIDKFIIELFEADDENSLVSIEGIQDIESTNYVMQIKHKEMQAFSFGKIKEPVIQLIEEFKRNPEKEYRLYCYFQNKTPSTYSITIEDLSQILTPSAGRSKEAIRINERIRAIDQSTRESFLHKFKIIFAPNYANQFSAAIDKVAQKLNLADKELATVYYSNIVDYVIHLVTGKNSPQQRSCSRKIVLEYLSVGKRRIFCSAYKEYKGADAYYALIRRQFVAPKKNQKNLFFFGEMAADREMSLGTLIIQFVSKYFKNSTIDIAPPTFVLPNSMVREVKIDLIQAQIAFNDGYEQIEFSEHLFLNEAIKSAKIIGRRATDSLGAISYKLKILSEETFSHSLTRKQYQVGFIFNASLPTGLDCRSTTKIDGLTTTQLSKLLCS